MVANSREKGHHYQLSKLSLSLLLSLYAQEIVKEISFLQERFISLHALQRRTGFSMEAGAASDHDSATGAVVVFQPLSHPVLRGVDPVKVSQFWRDRQRYELEVVQKQKEVPSLSLASFNVSVDPGLLRCMHFMGKLRAKAPGKGFTELTSQDIVNWTQSLIKKTDSTYDPAIIEKALSTLRIQVHIADLEVRVLEYCNEYFLFPEAVGYDDFEYENPKETVTWCRVNYTPSTSKT